MNKLLIRHPLSYANDERKFGTLAFASPDAELMPAGRGQALALGHRLRRFHGIAREEAVATSQYRRTQQAARYAGFKTLHAYAGLNEVQHGVPLLELRSMLDNGQIPDTAMAAAESVLEHPPSEAVWFTHGLVIAAMSRLLGGYEERRLVPRFCEVREFEIN